uniref:Uncharacterized protein n=1 Tax=Romanomermis culicivorax TaxID=13658 RepID=A0A915I118_ROMCU
MNNGLNLTCIKNDAFQNNPTSLFCEADDWSSDYNSTEQSSSSSSLLLLDIKPYSNSDHSDFETPRNFEDDDDDEDSFISVDDANNFDGTEKSEKQIIGMIPSVSSPSNGFSYTDRSDSHRSYNIQSDENDEMLSIGNPSSSVEWFDHYRPKNIRRKRKLSPIAAGQIISNAPSEKRSCGDSLDESPLLSPQFSQCGNSCKALNVGQSSCELQGLISVFKTGMTGVGSTTTAITKPSITNSSQSVTELSGSIDVENEDGGNVVGDDGDIHQRDILLAKKSQKTSLTEPQAILELTCAS